MSALSDFEVRGYSLTKHAKKRAQQRGIPPMVYDHLLSYGAENYDGRGGIVRFFTNEGIKEMQRDLGVDTVKKMSEYLRCYLVENMSGQIITISKKHTKSRITQ